jgi:hypothetical protein
LGLHYLGVALHERDAQMRFLLRAGLHITHIESHHHAHTRPLLLPLAKAVQAQHLVRRVRKLKNIIPLCLERGPRRAEKLMLKGIWNGALQLIAPQADTVGLFGRVADFVGRARELPPRWWSGRTIELMCNRGDSNTEFVQECDWPRRGLASVVGFEIDFITYRFNGASC